MGARSRSGSSGGWLSLPVLSGDRTTVVLIVVACNTIVV
jgi:hypothetical protein